MVNQDNLYVSGDDAAVILGKDAPQPQETPQPAEDQAKAIELKVAPRVAEARALAVTDQASLNLAGERLAVNKALQKEAGEVFDPLIAKAHDAHKAAIAAKKKVTDPLVEEERLLKGATRGYLDEQQRIAEAAERKARDERARIEREAFEEAERVRKAKEAEVNAQIQREHEEEVERALEELPTDAAPELVAAIAETPAPEYVRVAHELPPVIEVAAAPVTAVSMPTGMSVSYKYSAEVVNLAELCRAVGAGKVPTSYITANMTAINARARADREALQIPGVRVKRESTIRQGTK